MQSNFKNQSIVYILKCQQFYKIGYTTDLAKRIKSLQTGNPFEIIIHKTYKVVHKNAERIIHNRFVELNKRGEWYELTEGVISELDGFIEGVNATFEYLNIKSFTPKKRISNATNYNNLVSEDTLRVIYSAYMNFKKSKGHAPKYSYLQKKTKFCIKTIGRAIRELRRRGQVA